MPRSKSGLKRIPVDTESMKKAIEAVTAPPETRLSIRGACKVFNVKNATLLRHLKAFKDLGAEKFEYKANYAVKKIFTDEEETKLVIYMKTVAEMNYGLSKKRVRELAYKFAVANKKNYPSSWDEHELAGEEWMRLFLKRHSDVSGLVIKKPEKASLPCAININKTHVGKFFDNLEDIHKCFGPFAPEKIWNQDETELTTVSAECEQFITVSVCINAMGIHIPPVMVFPKKHFEDFMLKGAPQGTLGVANPTGWSNETVYFKFMEHFIKHTKPSKEERVLLIIDNDESHLSVETLNLASNSGVVILTFPPHTSHRLQPLDLAVYCPFKTYYHQEVEAWHIKNPGKTFDIYSVAEIVGQAYPRAFTTSNITSGFKKSGIYPLDRSEFNDDDHLVVTCCPDLNLFETTSNIGKDNSSSLKGNEKTFLKESFAGPSTSTQESSTESCIQSSMSIMSW